MLPEVRMARVLDAISSHRAGRLSCVEAGELFGFSERRFRRLRDAFAERGKDGRIDRRRGQVSARAADEAEAAWVAEMVASSVAVALRERGFWTKCRAQHFLTGRVECGSCAHQMAAVGQDYLRYTEPMTPPNAINLQTS